jgi:hypothetical protein
VLGDHGRFVAVARAGFDCSPAHSRTLFVSHSLATLAGDVLHANMRRWLRMPHHGELIREGRPSRPACRRRRCGLTSREDAYNSEGGVEVDRSAASPGVDLIGAARSDAAARLKSNSRAMIERRTSSLVNAAGDGAAEDTALSEAFLNLGDRLLVDKAGSRDDDGIFVELVVA